MKRYYVVSVKSATGPSSSYSVLDRYECHRELAAFDAPESCERKGVRADPWRRREAYATAARLNTLEGVYDDAA